MQADPIGLDAGISLYGYVVGNPLAFIDPLGLSKCPAVERGTNGEPLRAKFSVSRSDIGTGTPTNASSRAYAREMGNASDDAGHIRARNLGGSGGKDNVFAQLPNINRGDFATFEGQVASFVKKNGTVNVEMRFGYPSSGGARPTSVSYDVYKNGRKILTESFLN